MPVAVTLAFLASSEVGRAEKPERLGPVVKTLPSNEGGAGWIPDGEIRIPHASWPKKATEKKYSNKFKKGFKNGSHIKIFRKGKNRMLTKLDLLFCCCLVTKLCSTLLQPCGRSIPASPVRSQARILEWVAISFCRDLSNPGIKSASPASQADTLPLSHHRSQGQNSHFFFNLKIAISFPF